jgi:hypothetical protein
MRKAQRAAESYLRKIILASSGGISHGCWETSEICEEQKEKVPFIHTFGNPTPWQKVQS